IGHWFKSSRAHQEKCVTDAKETAPLLSEGLLLVEVQLRYSLELPDSGLTRLSFDNQVYELGLAIGLSTLQEIESEVLKVTGSTEAVAPQRRVTQALQRGVRGLERLGSFAM